MNLLFVHANLISPYRGGTERVTHTVGKSLQQRGHHIHFLATTECAPDNPSLIPEEQLFMPLLEKENDKLSYIKGLCLALKIDVIINELGDSDSFNIFSKHNFQKTKIISCLHFDVYGQIKFFNEKVHSPSKWKQIAWNFLDILGINAARITFRRNKQKRLRKMLQCSHAVVVPTATLTDQVKRFTGLNTPNVFHIDNPYPFDRIVNKCVHQEKENIILYAGRLSKEKQIHILINAWSVLCKEFPSWRLIILGEGNLRNELENQARQLECERFQFLGNVSNIEDYYNSSKILALTSAHECTAGVVLESLAHYMHPVVFHYPSVREFITAADVGTILSRKNEKALIKGIRKAIKGWDIKKQHNIDSLMPKFDKNYIARKWENLCLQLTKDKT